MENKNVQTETARPEIKVVGSAEDALYYFWKRGTRETTSFVD